MIDFIEVARILGVFIAPLTMLVFFEWFSHLVMRGFPSLEPIAELIKNAPAPVTWNCKNCGGPNHQGRTSCEYCGKAKE